MFSNLYPAPSISTALRHQILADAPIAYWPMNDLVNARQGYGSFVDIMPNPQPAVATGPITFAAANILPGLLGSPHLPGNQYLNFTPVSTPNKFTFASSSTITVEAWVSLDVSGTTGDIIAFNPDSGLRISTVTSGPSILIYYNGSLITTQNIRTQTYQHVVCVLGPGGCQLYINGTLIYSNAVAWSGTSGAACTIGGRSGEYLTGYISNAAVYNYALSQARIQSHFAAGGGLVYGSVIAADSAAAYWPLSDTGSTAVDAIGTWGSSGYSVLPTANGSYQGSYIAHAQAAARNLSPSTGMSNGSYVQAGYSTTVNPTVFSYEVWFTTPYSGMIMGFQDTLTPGAAINWDRALYVSASGQLGFGTINVATVSRIEGGPDLRNVLDWHHAVVTYSNNGNGTAHAILYLDGYRVAENTAMQLASAYSSGSGDYYFTIGYSNAGSTWQNVDATWVPISDGYHGSISDVAYYNTVLTASQVANHFTAGALCTGYTAVKLYFNGSYADTSAFAHSTSLVGTPSLSTVAATTYSKSMLCSQGNFMTIAANRELTLNVDFTVDFYTQFTSLPSTSQYCAWIHQPTAPGLIMFYDGGLVAANTIIVSDGTTNFIEYAWTPTVGTWYHIQLERLQAVLYLFINGSLVAQATCSSVFAYGITDIGGASSSPTNSSMLGYISAFTVNNGQAVITP